MKLAGMVCALVVCSGALLPAKDGPRAPAQQKKPAAAVQGDTEAMRGERAFAQNCSRCHDAPETLSTHVAKTVLRHMRVRAGLQAADERAILYFINRE